jgi:hypothetical protein
MTKSTAIKTTDAKGFTYLTVTHGATGQVVSYKVNRNNRKPYVMLCVPQAGVGGVFGDGTPYTFIVRANEVGKDAQFHPGCDVEWIEIVEQPAA